jgi:hypothetical protein
MTWLNSPKKISRPLPKTTTKSTTKSTKQSTPNKSTTPSYLLRHQPKVLYDLSFAVLAISSNYGIGTGSIVESEIEFSLVFPFKVPLSTKVA